MKEERDNYFMKKCFRLARKAEGKTSPNPLVGAVIVKNGKLLSQGYHKRAGSLHAEAFAIQNASRGLKGATLYVNLEPCSTYGKTPPCVEKIIKAGIKRVVVANIDPNPLHRGKGLKILREHGIEVIEGVLSQEGREINRVFFKHMVKKIPYVSLKIAESLDARIADFRGNSKWLSSETALEYVRSRIRPGVDAVLVGINTIVKDDPLLTARHPGGALFRKQPLRVILDSKLRIPLSANVIRDKSARTLIATEKKIGRHPKLNRLKALGIELVKVDSKNGRINLFSLLRELYKSGVCHLLVEGGSEVIKSFISQRLVDEINIFLSNKILGGPYLMYKGGAFELNLAPKLKGIKFRKFDDSILIKGELEYV